MTTKKLWMPRYMAEQESPGQEATWHSTAFQICSYVSYSLLLLFIHVYTMKMIVDWLCAYLIIKPFAFFSGSNMLITNISEFVVVVYLTICQQPHPSSLSHILLLLSYLSFILIFSTLFFVIETVNSNTFRQRWQRQVSSDRNKFSNLSFFSTF